MKVKTKNKELLVDGLTINDLIVKRIDNICKKEPRINGREITPYRISKNGNFNPRTLNNILSKTIKDPRISTIYKVCNGLNISLKEFFNDDLFDDKNVLK